MPFFLCAVPPVVSLPFEGGAALSVSRARGQEEVASPPKSERRDSASAFLASIDAFSCLCN